MNQTAHIILRLLSMAGVAAIVISLGLRALKRSEDPPRLILKWFLSAIVLSLAGLLAWYLSREIDRGVVNYGAAFFGGTAAAALGLLMALIWKTSIAGWFAKPFAGLYDGGSEEIDPHPLYSAAIAKRKRGNYTEAIADIRAQLDKFPNDFEGQLMLAEIQAENMNDLQGAEVAIQRICNQPGHAPRHIALALNTLADWHLKFGQDRESARQCLEKIIELLPDSEMSALASQRIGHLADTEQLLASHDRKRIQLKPGVQDLGLLSADQRPKASDADPARQAAECVNHLREHPLDTEAREKLAVLYAEHYGRLELATEQLEQLISHPGQPARRVVHWLNLLADLQIRHSADYETVRRTIERIVELFPNSAAAQTARNRLDHLKLELKSKVTGQTVKLGQYEQDLGLKGRLPNKL